MELLVFWKEKKNVHSETEGNQSDETINRLIYMFVVTHLGFSASVISPQ